MKIQNFDKVEPLPFLNKKIIGSANATDRETQNIVFIVKSLTPNSEYAKARIVNIVDLVEGF